MKPQPDAADKLIPRYNAELTALLDHGAPLPRAVLAAARIAAKQDAMSQPASDMAALMAIMAAETPASVGTLDKVWRMLRPSRSIMPHCLDAEDVAVIRSLWPMLDLTESIMETGGDMRLHRDPVTALNGYGCSHRPRPWAITFASSTASSVSERGYQAAEARRRSITAGLLRSSDRTAVFEELHEIRRSIMEYFGMRASEAVVLAASGTDSELLALALTHLAAPDAPILNILLAPEETGSGVPMAARGCHFAIDTANGHEVDRQGLIEGFRADTVLLSISLRDINGAVLPPREVSAAVIDAVETGVGEGRRVILHVLDLSKTGLLAPGIEVLRELRTRHGDRFDIVVDACQTRIAPVRVREYLALDAVVQVTGSKFFTGPPFAGAALLPAAVAARLHGGVLPMGLDAYFGKGEWPDVPAARHLPDTANYGLALRWRAALAEMQAFAAVPDDRKADILDRFAATVAHSMAKYPQFALQDIPALERDGSGWDTRRSVFSFAMQAPFMPKRFLAPEEARKIYQWLNADCAALFGTADEQALALWICHIGQPVALADNGSRKIGLLRVSAGARLISGEPSHQALEAERRIDREMADLAIVFDKIALLCTAWARVAKADPIPCYWPRE
jgi:hypothetical protein